MSAPLHLDVLAAVRYLRKTGAKRVSVVGGQHGLTMRITNSDGCSVRGSLLREKKFWLPGPATIRIV